MKKSIIPFLAIATLLASCGGNSSTGDSSNTDDSSTSTAAKYSVTASKGNDYKVEGLAEDGYEAGATVSFTVSISNTNKEVDKVIVDGTQLVPSNGTYSFTMPSKNVNIIVQLKDKAGVKVATIAVDNEAPKVGDTVNVTLKLDGEALTSGVSVTATSGADLVTITGTAVKCNDVGAITLEASATVDGIEYKKTIDLTIGEATKITSIKTIQDVMPTFTNKNATYESQVTVEGRVINVNYNGIVVYDGTGIISVYDSDSKTVAKVGEYVRITGTPTRYQSSASDTRWWQFSYSDTGLSIAKIEHSEIALPEAVAFSASDFSSYVTPAAGTVKRVTFSGTVAIDGNHTNISMDGVTGRTLSYYSEDFTVENGLKYNFEAFLAELQSGQYLVAYVTNVTAAEMDPVESVTITNGATASIQQGKSLQLEASVLPATANPNVSWSSSDTSKATVSEDGRVSALAEGTVVITATTDGKGSDGNAKTATISITITASSTPENLVSETFDWSDNTFKPTTSTPDAVFTVGNATVTLNGGGTDGTNWSNGYAIRVYKGKTLTIGVTSGTLYSAQVIIDNFKTDYVTAFEASGAVTGGDYVKNADRDYTITASDDTIVISASAGQIRIDKIVVSYVPAA